MLKRNPNKPYHAQISINGKMVGLGYYATPEEATAVYLAERKKHPRAKRGVPKGTPRVGGRWQVDDNTYPYPRTEENQKWQLK